MRNKVCRKRPLCIFHILFPESYESSPIFDAASVGQTTREVRVVVDGKELAHVAIDFAMLE